MLNKKNIEIKYAFGYTYTYIYGIQITQIRFNYKCSLFEKCTHGCFYYNKKKFKVSFKPPIGF